MKLRSTCHYCWNVKSEGWAEPRLRCRYRRAHPHRGNVCRKMYLSCLQEHVFWTCAQHAPSSTQFAIHISSSQLFSVQRWQEQGSHESDWSGVQGSLNVVFDLTWLLSKSKFTKLWTDSIESWTAPEGLGLFLQREPSLNGSTWAKTQDFPLLRHYGWKTFQKANGLFCTRNAKDVEQSGTNKDAFPLSTSDSCHVKLQLPNISQRTTQNPICSYVYIYILYIHISLVHFVLQVYSATPYWLPGTFQSSLNSISCEILNSRTPFGVSWL